MGMLVEGAMLGTMSRITWIAYTECKNAGGAVLSSSSAMYDHLYLSYILSF